MLRKNYGCVRVDFAQPFSLKVSFGVLKSLTFFMFQYWDTLTLILLFVHNHCSYLLKPILVRQKDPCCLRTHLY